MADYAIHPAADKMPRMSEQEFAGLVESIRLRGLIDPIVLCDGMILDGRHRYAACQAAELEPRFVEFSGGNPWQFVWDRNGERRHFKSDEQKVLVFRTIAVFADEWEAERKAITDAANAARSEAAKDGRVGRAAAKSAEEFSGRTDSAPTKPKADSRDAIAEKIAVNRGAVQRAEQLAKERPDLAEKVAVGEMKAGEAVRKLTEDRRKADLERPVAVAVAGLLRGDFRDMAASIPESSVDLVFTDPPYDRDSLPLYEDAAREAARILKPGGSMICYVGQVLLPEAMASMSKHLRYWWTAACIHEGGNQMMQKLGIRCGWKPLLWFVKGTRGDISNVLIDTVSGSREKGSHEWQQAEAEAAYFIEKLCSPAGIVVDFFAGGGTTCVAAERLGRKWVAFEIDARHYESAARRLGNKEAA